MKKFEFQKDKDLQLEEASVPGPKSEDQTEELHSASCFAGQPKGMGHSDKPKHLLADSSMIAREVKVEKVDQLETVKTEKSDNSPKMDVASRGGTSQIAKESSTDEVSCLFIVDAFIYINIKRDLIFCWLTVQISLPASPIVERKNVEIDA